MSKDKGLILAADDLQVGMAVAIHSWRDDKKHWLGDGLEIKAICLPYLVVKFVSVQEWPSVTLDTRQVKLMAVTPEFVAAQRGGYPTDLADAFLNQSAQAEEPHDD
jgi:hypothetical protein